MTTMGEDKTRVDFNAPASLVERADLVADLLDTSRTSLLVDALRDELQEVVGDEAFQRRVREAYYRDRIDFERVESLLGTEEAMRMRLLRQSLDREPPDPAISAGDLPTQAEFYEGTVAEWTPDEPSTDDESAE